MQGRYDPTAGSRLRDWYDQMLIGFKLTHPLSNFGRQLDIYRKKMAEAEEGVKVFFDQKP